MDITQFKQVFVLYSKSMLDKWFDTKSINDSMCKALGYTLIDANVNKYDSYLTYMTDNEGNILIELFLDNLINNYIPYQLDLTKFNIPFLPNKILLVGKLDLEVLKNMCKLKCNISNNIIVKTETT